MKVLVHGSYFAPNFGDVLLWQHSAAMVRESIFDAEILTLNRPRALRSYYPDRAIRDDERADLVVFTGGGYFCPPENGHAWELRNWYRHRAALQRGSFAQRAMFLGVGVGDLKHPWFRKLLRSALNNAEMVSVRDIESLSAVSKLSTCPVQVTPDLALTAAPRMVQMGENHREEFRELAIHADFAGMTAEARDLFVDACKRLLLVARHDVKFLVDCPSASARESARQLATVLGITKPEIIEFDGSCSRFLRDIRSSGVIATTKLHVGICATALGRPVLSVPKHHKTLRFFSQVGLQDCVIRTAGDIEEYMAKAIYARGPDNSETLAELRKAGDDFIVEACSLMGQAE